MLRILKMILGIRSRIARWKNRERYARSNRRFEEGMGANLRYIEQKLKVRRPV